jgi:hypothetical protein
MDRFRPVSSPRSRGRTHSAALPDEADRLPLRASPPASCAPACTSKGSREVNRAKAFSRVGMGRCQGATAATPAPRSSPPRRVPIEASAGCARRRPVKPLLMNCARGADAG